MSNFEKVPVGILNKVENNKQIFIAEFKDKLQEVFPSAVKDGIVDFEALLNEFGKYAETDEKEKYNMTWVGKKEAIKTANEDIIGKTLKYVPEDSKNPETTQNLYIEGDNLEVLKLLRNSYYGKIKMIYIDPPYNTGNDFIYKDNFKMDKEEYEKLEGSIDEYNERLTASKKGSGRYHSDWMNMIYPRLKIARDLLDDDGVIFISIDDNEIDNLKKICNEVFSEENFIANIIRNTNSSKNQSLFVSVSHEYCLVYSKNINILIKKHSDNKWSVDKNNIEEYIKKVNELKKMGLNKEEITNELKNLTKYPRFIDFTNYWYIDERGIYQKGDLGGVKNGNNTSIFNPLTNKYDPIPPGGFRYTTEKLNALIKDNRIHFHEDGSLPRIKRYLKENMKQRPKSIMSDDQRPDNFMLKEFNTPFDNPKQLDFIKRIISIEDNDCVILDFFSGSATTAHATMQLNSEDNGNRKFIMVQLPELCNEKSEAYKNGYKNICEIGKERIRRAGEKIKEENKDKEGIENLDIGFKVFRVSDTNIRWISDAIKSNEGVEEKDIITQEELRDNESYKDRLDFNLWFTDLDVVYEMMLKRQDIELTEKIEKLSYIGDRTYLVGYTILVCLEENITEEMVRKISEIETFLSWIVFRDSAFDDDINLKTNTINLLRTLIKEKNPRNKNQKILWI